MFILNRIQTYLAVAGVVLVAVIGAYFRGKSDAHTDAEVQGYKDTLDKMRTAKEVEDEVEELDDIGLSDRASKWLRNADK